MYKSSKNIKGNSLKLIMQEPQKIYMNFSNPGNIQNFESYIEKHIEKLF